MRNDDPKTAVRRQLKAFFDAVMDEALVNPEFMSRLEKLFVNVGTEGMLSGDSRMPSNKKASSPNLLEVLHARGEPALREELDAMTTDQLARTSVQEGVRKLKEAKALDRVGLINLLVETTRNRLRQGESFVRRGV